MVSMALPVKDYLHLSGDLHFRLVGTGIIYGCSMKILLMLMILVCMMTIPVKQTVILLDDDFIIKLLLRVHLSTFLIVCGS